MKKSRSFKRLLLAGAMLSGALAIAACNAGGSSDSAGTGNSANGGVLSNIDSSVTVGGNTGVTAENKIVISGATDIHLTKKATSINDWAKNVQAVRGSETFNVQVDDSNVQYGVQGNYTATYSYQTESVTVNVIVYGDPVITVSNSSAQVSYSQFGDEVTAGVTAVDCFSNAIETFVYSYGGAKNADGSLNIGTFTVRYGAIDRAGQIVYAEKQVTIVADRTPVLETAYAYDVADDQFVFPLEQDDYEVFLSLALDGVAVPSKYVKRKNGNIVVDGDYVYSVCEKHVSYPIRIMTARGYADSSFVMKDEGIVAYDDSAVVEFVDKYYPCFKGFDVPRVALTNAMQTVTPVYELYFNGVQVPWTDGKFNVDTEGVYTLKITLREGQEKEYSVQTYYDLGYTDGACYNQATDIAGLLKDAYTMRSISVTCLATDTIVARYTAGDDKAAFTAEVAALNKKYTYALKVKAATDGGRELVQNTQFTVADSTVTDVALGDKATLDNGSFFAKKSEYASLTYAYGDIGGKTGAFKWSSSDPSYAATQTLLRFGDEFRGKVLAGKYVTFSIYVQKGINLCAFFPGREVRLWQEMKYYTPEYYETLSGDQKIKELDTYENYYKGVRFFDENGKQITTGGGFNSGAFKGKWITVEIEIPVNTSAAATSPNDHDVTSDYCGISVYNAANNGVYDGGDKALATYIANVKLSSVKYMDDNTENGVVESGPVYKEDEGIIKDTWDK